MPRHGRRDFELSDKPDVQALVKAVKALTGETHGAKADVDGFELNLLRVLRQAAKEIVAESKSRSGKAAKAKRPPRKR